MSRADGSGGGADDTGASIHLDITNICYTR